jgi:hypothetical protein
MSSSTMSSAGIFCFSGPARPLGAIANARAPRREHETKHQTAKAPTTPPSGCHPMRRTSVTSKISTPTDAS